MDDDQPGFVPHCGSQRRFASGILSIAVYKYIAGDDQRRPLPPSQA